MRPVPCPMRFAVAALAGLLLGAPASPASAQTGERAGSEATRAVVDRVIDAYGGADAIAAVNSHRQEGMLVARNGGGHGQVTRISKGMGSLSVLVSYPTRSEIRIVEDGSGWRGTSPETMAQVDGPLRLAMVAQAARAHLPRIMVDFRDGFRLLPPTADGAVVLALTVTQGLDLRMFVDPETSYIVRSESVFTEMGGPFGFATNYSDFRTVDGVVFAFQEETFASGVHTASLVLGTVQLNPTGDRARLPVRH